MHIRLSIQPAFLTKLNIRIGFSPYYRLYMQLRDTHHAMFYTVSMVIIHIFQLLVQGVDNIQTKYRKTILIF